MSEHIQHRARSPEGEGHFSEQVGQSFAPPAFSIEASAAGDNPGTLQLQKAEGEHLESEGLAASSRERVETTFSDEQVAEFVSYTKALGFEDRDIDALLIVKVRKPWVDLEGMKAVARTVWEAAQNEQIKFKYGWDFMTAYRIGQQRMLVGYELDPAEYLEPVYIEAHLEQFEEECSYLMDGETYDNWVIGRELIGRPDGQFVSTSKSVDRILQSSSGDIAQIEMELGIPAGLWQGKGGIVRIDVQQPENIGLRMPFGHESGANEFWHP